jgi:hypothetical protein
MKYPAFRGRFSVAAVLIAILGGAFSAGCSNDDPKAPPLATPSLTLKPSRVPLGYPIDMTYRFVVANDAKFTKDYRVMVHVVDQDDGLMYLDDHDLPTPTTSWKPGQTIEYTRRFFAPVYPYVGDATIEVGLYCKDCELRAPLAGDDVGHRAYKVAKLTLLPQSEGVSVIFKDGWYVSEGSDTTGDGAWHWTKKDATLAIKNPKKDSTFYLKVGNPKGPYKEPQHVTVSLEGGVPLDQFSTSSDEGVILRTISIPAAAWGDRETVELRLAVDKSYIPKLLPTPVDDPRELGIRVFRAVVVPAGS